MSDNIPFEIQIEIINKLPIKSLLQFRSVSKQWKSLIDSSEFVAGYSVPQRLFVRYIDTESIVHLLINTVTFAQQELPPTNALHQLFRVPQVIGSSHGLICLYGCYRDPVPDDPRYHPKSKIAVLWNPSIRKLVGVVVHHVEDAPAPVILGFGVCPITLDPTIVKITWTDPWIVEIFTLSTESWRISSCNLHNQQIKVYWYQVAIGKFIYWLAFEIKVAEDGGDEENCLIVSFDMTTEKFREINLPDVLAQKSRTSFSISKLRESLAVIEYIAIDNNPVPVVWMMNHHDALNTFTKLFTINTSCASMWILAFTERGEAIMETNNDYNTPTVLVAYEPSSENIKDIGIYGGNGSFLARSYMETLLLHNELDCSVYSDISFR